MTRTRIAWMVGVAFAVILGWRTEARAQWTALTNAPPGFLDPCLLLTDGTVMCHEYNTNRWHRLSPDINGSYANGTWNSTPILAMPNGNDPSFGCVNCTYQPLFFCSSVLADGRVVVIGGEYVNLSAVWTNIGFIYNPVGDPGDSPGDVVGAAHRGVRRRAHRRLDVHRARERHACAVRHRDREHRGAQPDDAGLHGAEPAGQAGPEQRRELEHLPTGGC